MSTKYSYEPRGVSEEPANPSCTQDSTRPRDDNTVPAVVSTLGSLCFTKNTLSAIWSLVTK